MEKICIVHRRKKIFSGKENQLISPWRNNFSAQHVVVGDVEKRTRDNNKQVISFSLTQEQGELIKSNEQANSILKEGSYDFHVDVGKNETGQIIFKFNLDQWGTGTTRMLKSEQVCQMLQIGKSFLQKLVVEKKMKSYKLGKLRRFSMDDVLEYLTKNEDFSVIRYKPTF
ncbi:MAG: helix-turn-helix domain-containing protein [Candidatus Brocadiaceae bacterium]|nr:helix-turn-helix domain-containing protein [Candidatus Brocadiaceae bacterium]